MIRQAKGDRRLGDQNTDGSNSIRFFYKTMRTAGATARNMLEQAATNRWEVDVKDVSTTNHTVYLNGVKKKLEFHQLVEDARKLEAPKAEDLRFKSPQDFQYIGKKFPIADMDAILTGEAIFGIDAHIEGQVHAVVVDNGTSG